jgi:hypothetical protein
MNATIRKPRRTVADILTDALALIESRYSWTKGDYFFVRKNGRKCFCANGAVEHAAYGTNRLDGIFKHRSLAYRAEKALEAHIPAGFGCVEAFNDDNRTTHRDVVDLFKRAIKAAS